MAIAALTQWSTQQVLTSATLNANFATIRDHYNANAVETSGAQTIAGVKTFSSIPVFSAGVSVTTGGVAVTAGGVTVTAGGISVAAGTTAVQALTCTTLAPSGTSTLQGVTCTTFTASGAIVLNGAVTLGNQGAYKRHSGGDAGATPAIDWANGNVQCWTLDQNATPTFANPVVGSFYMLELIQGSGGSKTVTWSGATIVWVGGTAPTLTTTASRKDAIVLVCVDASSSGTYLGAVFGHNYNNTTA